MRGIVPRSETGATGDQDHLHQRVGDPGAYPRANLPDIVDHQGTLNQCVTGRLQPLDQGLPRSIGGQTAGIADGQDGDA
ncbi:hypothetical protein D9M68_960260 [compost metagenome]